MSSTVDGSPAPSTSTDSPAPFVKPEHEPELSSKAPSELEAGEGEERESEEGAQAVAQPTVESLLLALKAKDERIRELEKSNERLDEAVAQADIDVIHAESTTRNSERLLYGHQVVFHHLDPSYGYPLVARPRNLGFIYKQDKDYRAYVKILRDNDDTECWSGGSINLNMVKPETYAKLMQVKFVMSEYATTKKKDVVKEDTDGSVMADSEDGVGSMAGDSEGKKRRKREIYSEPPSSELSDLDDDATPPPGKKRKTIPGTWSGTDEVKMDKRGVIGGGFTCRFPGCGIRSTKAGLAAHAAEQYYPPNWTPEEGSLNKYHGKHALGDRARKLDQGILIVRFELPYNIWCGHCGNHIGQGVRYNAEKKKVGMYYTTPIWSFRCKCHLCQGWFEIRTDPKNTAYFVHEGAKAQASEWDAAENGTVVLSSSSTDPSAPPPDPFASLEKTVTQKKVALTAAKQLDQLQELQDDRWSDPPNFKMAPQSHRVIVVGGGLSGLSAAHTLYERGARVLVLDKNSFFGGNSTKATSGINGAGTKAQAKLGIKDSAKAFFDDTKKSAKDLARDDLIDVLTGKSGEAVDWLVKRFNLDLSEVSRLGGHSFERTHRGNSGTFPGYAITMAEMEALEDLAQADPERVEIRKKAEVKSLIKEGDAVVGVEYSTREGEIVKEYGPVILATGGYAADFKDDGLLKKYRPELMGLPTTNGDHCTGDGQKMGIAIGGAAIDLEKVQVHPTGLVDPKDPDAKVKFLAAEALRGVGGLLLDRDGNRFADELGTRDYVTGRMWENDKFPVRLILNGQASKEIEWHCKHYCGRGLMKRFETGEELAKEMGIPAKKLQEVFSNYTDIVKDPKKDPFGKKFFSNTDWGMKSGPFNVALMTPVLHYTMGGLQINEDSQVIDTAGKPIPGLYASGEIAGGVHGANRLGGSSLLGCVVFGRVAGDSASSYLMKSLSSSTAAARLGQVGGHLGMATTIRIDPASKKVHLEFNWDDQGAVSAPSGGGGGTGEQQGKETKAVEGQQGEKKSEKKEMKEYTLEEVGKHTTKEDCWVVVNGQILDVTNFLPDHPGGPKAILLYAGKDATEEFNMVHEKSVVQKYASDCIIGTLKA
ncbi:hypothetical protein MNV49_006325 [Pseudohyphozyma bogoriensis]|nr:hypothetical protein MNV49_006325 [Pseudohyphozyma bogoriensis]